MAGGLQAGERTDAAREIGTSVKPWKPAIS
jgi:hypothetical protein